jgi:hypothetical protein
MAESHHLIIAAAATSELPRAAWQSQHLANFFANLLAIARAQQSNCDSPPPLVEFCRLLERHSVIRRVLMIVNVARVLRAVALLAFAAAIYFSWHPAASAGIVGGDASGDISLTIAGGPVDSTGLLIPMAPYPGMLELGPSSVGPTAYYMAESWPLPASGAGSPFIPFITGKPPAFDKAEVIMSPSAGVESVLTGHVDAHYTLDLAGLDSITVSMSYPATWAVGGPGSHVAFDATVEFTDPHGAWGPPDDLAIHFSIPAGPSFGGAILTSNTVTLPALAGGLDGDPSFDVHATFKLTEFVGIGEGGGFMKIAGVPEPSSLLLAAVGGVIAIGARSTVRSRKAC